MSQVLAVVIPLAVLGALSPFYITLVILMLISKNYPLARATAFVIGFMTALVVIGTIAYVVLSDFFSNVPEIVLRPAAYLVIATLGTVMVVLGIRQLLTAIDPDESSQRSMERILQLRPFLAFWIGFAFSALSLKTLGIYAVSLAIILSNRIGFIPGLATLAIVVVLLVSTMWIPIIVYRARREGGAELMEKTYTWMQAQKARIGGAVLLLIGVLMVWIGLQGI